jgi:hypothetical protein
MPGQCNCEWHAEHQRRRLMRVLVGVDPIHPALLGRYLSFYPWSPSYFFPGLCQKAIFHSVKSIYLHSQTCSCLVPPSISTNQFSELAPLQLSCFLYHPSCLIRLALASVFESLTSEGGEELSYAMPISSLKHVSITCNVWSSKSTNIPG